MASNVQKSETTNAPERFSEEAVLVLTAANNISTTAEEVAAAVRKSSYYNASPRSVGEVRKVLKKWGKEAPYWAEVGLHLAPRPRPRPRPRLPAPQVAPQVAPQEPVLADCLLPDGGAVLNGKVRNRYFIKWLLENASLYLELKRKAAQ